ncbi:MAG TPA: CHAP domain-containing protein, partial [Acidimicrobiales bacterium]|nr:CHAP domain-containing protein [Acidimicrobiales bacterium]
DGPAWTRRAVSDPGERNGMVTEGSRPLRRLAGTLAAVLVLALAGLGLTFVGRTVSHADAPTTTSTVPMTPLQARIVSVAESQVGYTTDPPDTYCNKYSAYWVSGTADCGNDDRDEEWCADFAAWVWKKAGAEVDFQFVNGDLDSSAASFYEWGVANGTWHPSGDGYVPQPGDVAVYGLDIAALVAAHVAVVTGYTPGDKGPDVVNGDGDRTGYSVVETGGDQVVADIPDGAAARLAGYVSPLPG